jgi:hypothetical protein
MTDQPLRLLSFSVKLLFIQLFNDIISIVNVKYESQAEAELLS